MKRRLSSISIILCCLFFIHGTAWAQPGITWTGQTTPTPATTHAWSSVAYGNDSNGNGLFVAVSQSGTGERVMTSPDGITWTLGITPADNNWSSVTYGNDSNGNGLFVAVAQSGTGNRVMTSPDGLTWTLGTTPADNNWTSVTYGTDTNGNGLFVAVAQTGTGNRVMTSPDGFTWTIGTTPVDNGWTDVTYGNGLFVAVAVNGGTTNRIMTSPDGITWTIRSSLTGLGLSSVTYGNGLYVAVAINLGGSIHLMTSPDGITWTGGTGVGNQWLRVVYANGLFVAVGRGVSGNRAMSSPDGTNWTLRTTPADLNWNGLAYGGNRFVAVAVNGTSNQAMISAPLVLPLHWLNVNACTSNAGSASINWEVEEQGVTGYSIEKSTDGAVFSTIGRVEATGDGRHAYSFTETEKLTGTAYFRIKQVDQNGTATYSRILSLHTGSSPMSLYPNPTKDLVTVSISNASLNQHAVVTNCYGQVLQTIKIAGSPVTVNLASYPSGMYFIKVGPENPVRVIKE